MSGSAPGAALPWGAPDAAPDAEQHEQLSQRGQALPVETLGMAIGSRIEVRRMRLDGILRARRLLLLRPM